MSKVNLDSNSNNPILPGTYTVSIGEYKLVKSPTKEPMLKVLWNIVDGKYAGHKVQTDVMFTVARNWQESEKSVAVRWR